MGPRKLWQAVQEEHRPDVAAFLENAIEGMYGFTAKEIRASAKKTFGALPDWPAILALLVAYLPYLLGLLKNG